MPWIYEEITVYTPRPKKEYSGGPLAIAFGIVFWIFVIGLMAKGCEASRAESNSSSHSGARW